MSCSWAVKRVVIHLESFLTRLWFHEREEKVEKKKKGQSRLEAKPSNFLFFFFFSEVKQRVRDEGHQRFEPNPSSMFAPG